MVEIKIFYRHGFFKSISKGLINPFISIFALVLGASNFLIGSLSGFVQLVYIISLIISSIFLLRIRKRGLALFFSTFLWALMWIVVGFSKNPLQLIIFLSIQAIFSAIITLSWTEIFVSFVPSYKRGEIIGRINWYNGCGAIIATLISGYILNKYSFINYVFFVASFFGILGSLNFLSLRALSLPISPFQIKVRESFKQLRKNKNFLNLLKARTFFQFAVGIGGPFLAVYVVKELGGSLIDVAIISVISSIFHLLFYKPWGFVVDFVGRKATMLSCILLISTLPLVYVITPNVHFLYFLVIFAAIGRAGFDIAAFAYFSDIAEKKNIFQLTASYNFSVELAGITANFFGGLIAQSFGIFTVLIASFILRLLTLIFFAEIKEKTGYKDVVKFETTIHPLHFIESSIVIYSILFSTLRKDMIRRTNFIERIRDFINFILKKIKM